MPLRREDRLREAIVVLPDDVVETWISIIERSGRLKSARADLLNRVVLAFHDRDHEAEEELSRVLLKDAPQLPEEASQFLSVLAGAQLIELFAAPSRTQTEPSAVDAAALAVRILGRTRRRPVFADLPEHANAWLAHRGDVTRSWRQGDVPVAKTNSVARDLSELTVDVQTWEAIQVAHNGLVEHVAEIAAGVDATREDLVGIGAALRALASGLSIGFEQQQIGWWIANPREGALNWQTAYEAAKELISLTRRWPGPRTAKALFERRLGVGEWQPDGDVTLDATVVDQRFAPGLTTIPIGDRPFDGIETAADAAVALFDELLLNWMLKS